jgi:hypothetical protein
VNSLSLNQSAELRRVFDRLGVNFSIFFATKVVWVEGATEEKAFPLILDKYLGSDAVSEITILPLGDTGSLQGKKNAKRMFEIYRTLSGAHALVPPIAAVILDDDNREHRIIADLKRLGGGLLHFLPRRCYENYLLDAAAVAAIANEQEDFAEQPIIPEQVTEIMENVRASGEFLSQDARNASAEIAREEWLERVDGARLLKKIFSVLSETRVTYEKTIHSVSLTKWLLANNRGDFQQIADLIEHATKQQGASVAV